MVKIENSLCEYNTCRTQGKYSTQCDLKFFQGCLVDIDKIKTSKNFLVRPRLQCDSFTGVTIQEKKEEDLALMRHIVVNVCMHEAMKCTCPENTQLITKIKSLYRIELVTLELIEND